MQRISIYLLKKTQSTTNTIKCKNVTLHEKHVYYY